MTWYFSLMVFTATWVCMLHALLAAAAAAFAQQLTNGPAALSVRVADIQQFIQQFYPELVPTPFNDFVSGAERSDLWRVLVLHKVTAIQCSALQCAYSACCDVHVGAVHADLIGPKRALLCECARCMSRCLVVWTQQLCCSCHETCAAAWWCKAAILINAAQYHGNNKSQMPWHVAAA
jgi:hypothetical protein